MLYLRYKYIDFMYKDILNELGLTKTQAEIMAFLLENGLSKASLIAQKTSVPRGVAYKGLDELLALGLVEKKETGTVARFQAEHPIKLEKIIENKEKEAGQARQKLTGLLPELVSMYNLANHKPGVFFYEGEEGIEQVLNDSLESKTEIYTYADLDVISGSVKEINARYAKERDKRGIKKKIIVPDTEANHKFFLNFDKTITEIRYLGKDFYQFQTGMQIYDGKISYQVIEANRKLAIIIQDPNVYQMHKLLFEFIWSQLKEVY